MKTFFVIMTDQNTFLSRIAGKPFLAEDINRAIQYESEKAAEHDLLIVRAAGHKAEVKPAKEEVTLL